MVLWYLDGIVLVNVDQNGEEVVDEDLITFVETIKGQTKACLGGFYYNMHCQIKRFRDNTKRYQCEYQRSHSCMAYIWEKDGRVTKRGENAHSHAPNAERLHHLQVGYVTVFENIQKSLHTSVV